MRKYILIILGLSLLIGAKCKKDDEECHSEVVCVNNSNDTIIWTMKALSSSYLCKLCGDTLFPSQNKKYEKRYCWEDEFFDNRKLEFYVVDPIKYDGCEEFYNCDSIEIKNKILKYYILDLEDLKGMNWTVTYPS